MEEQKAKINFKEFEADIKARFYEETDVEWLGRTIVIKKALSFAEMLTFVSSVVDTCYLDNGEGVTVFMPEVKDYAIIFNLVEFYTNIELAHEDENEHNGFDDYDFIIQSGIQKIILDNIDTEQFDSMIKAIASKIKYINDTSSATIMSEMDNLNNALTDIIPQITELFQGENKEKLHDAIGALLQMSQDADIRQLAIAQVKHGS